MTRNDSVTWGNVDETLTRFEDTVDESRALVAEVRRYLQELRDQEAVDDAD